MEYGYRNVQEFLIEYKASKEEYNDYWKAVARWEQQNESKQKVDGLKGRLQQTQQEVQEQENNRQSYYYRNQLLMDGKLNEHLHKVDEECYERVEMIIEQMKARAGITEELKAVDQMKWIGLLNNVMSAVEELVVKEIVYL